jgi:hypothetical protein
LQGGLEDVEHGLGHAQAAQRIQQRQFSGGDEVERGVAVDLLDDFG